MPVGYQGESFSYSDRAASELFPDRERIGFENFVAAFDALTDGEVGRLVLPIENSTTGSVLPVLDQLALGERRSLPSTMSRCDMRSWASRAPLSMGLSASVRIRRHFHKLVARSPVVDGSPFPFTTRPGPCGS